MKPQRSNKKLAQTLVHILVLLLLVPSWLIPTPGSLSTALGRDDSTLSSSQSANYKITADVLVEGGGPGNSGNYGIFDAIGDAVEGGESNSDNFTLFSGPIPVLYPGDVSEWSMGVQEGWSYISLPLDPITPYTAEGMCSEINSQGGNASEFDRWYNDDWDSHTCGSPSNDFDIELGSGYFIRSNAASTWSIEGEEVATSVPLALQVGWNSIGVPHTDAYTAESLCDEIINQGVTAVEIDRWYAGGWDGHICGLPFNDFSIEIGKGYFVRASSAGVVTPARMASWSRRLEPVLRAPILDIKTWIEQYQTSLPTQPPVEGKALEEYPLALGHKTISLEPTLPQHESLASTTLNSTADACILEGYPTENFGSTTDMWAGYDDYLNPDGEIVRSLVKFDLSTIPIGSTINSATFEAYLVGSWDYPNRYRDIAVYRITGSWSEGSVTWVNKPGFFSDSYDSRSIETEAWDWHSWDVKGLVQEWVNGTYSNHGLMLRGPEQSGADSAWRSFSTKEGSYPPRLIVDFTPPPICYSLTTSVDPSGSGTVSVSPAPNCEGDKYTSGTQVQLTANPASGYSFSHWSGDASGSANPTTITMDGNKSVTAHFSQICYRLATGVDPSGGGTVSVSPAPNCEGDKYTSGTQVQLTANPASGYNFSHWSGDASGSANPSTITMDGNKSVTAHFSQICYSLATGVDPSGGGTVSMSPAPNCEGDKYTAGTQVQLTANPASGYNFSHWSGDASGSDNPTTITMDGNKSVTAHFSQICYSLTTSVDPGGGGTVSVSPAPNCEGDKYASGTQVQLTANPASGYSFSHWSGDASGSANPTTITMDGNKSVTAHFTDTSCGPTYVGGPITSDTTWTAACSPYIVTSDILVMGGVRLTIEAGVVVKFDPGSSLTVNGQLLAEGTAGNEVYFTSLKDDSVGGDTNGDDSTTTPARGDWSYILLEGGQATLDYTVVRYGGYGAGWTRGNIWVSSSGSSLTISNSTISESQSAGIYINADSSTVVTITNSSIINNGGDAIFVDCGGGAGVPVMSGNTMSGNGGVQGVVLEGTLGVSMTLPFQPGVTYVVDSLTVGEGGALTIEAGVVVKFRTHTTLTVHGQLLAEGTAGNEVYFTSLKDDSVGGDTNGDDSTTAPAGGDWSCILLEGGQATLDYTVVRYGGYGAGWTRGNIWVSSSGSSLTISNSTISESQSAGIYINADSSTVVTITNSSIINNGGDAIFVDCGGGAGVPVMSGNTMSGNGGVQGVVLEGTLGVSMTLPFQPGVTYVVHSLTVGEGGALTIEAGVVVKFRTHTALTVHGQLLAEGTAGNEVYFTSLKDDSVGGDTNGDDSTTAPARGDWSYILLEGGQATLDYTVVRYGGYGAGWTRGNVWVSSSGSSLTISNSTISESNTAGIYINADSSTVVTVTNSSIINNGDNGVQIGGGASGNVIGPGNVVAYNGGHGIGVYNPDSLHNTITQNSIHDNDGMGIDLGDGGNTELAAPLITDFDQGGGIVTGTACPGCTVEVFSDSSDEGEVYEGQTAADGAGNFVFNKCAPLTGPHLTATATDMAGNTSEFSSPAVPPGPTISDVRTTNARDTSFTVSWITNVDATSEVHYGTDPANLDQVAYDDRGGETSDDTHYVTLLSLSPDTTYYFDVASWGTRDDNEGAHYMVTTGPTLEVPVSDTIYGQVFKEDETTPAEGTIVYITLFDDDQNGSPGQAALMSSLVDSSGYWYANLGNARTADLGDYFEYSASGDEMELEAQGASHGTASQTVDTANDSPAPSMVLGSIEPQIRRWVPVGVSGPSARHGHAMVYDPEGEVIVLFGGWDESGHRQNDTWEFNGSVWTHVIPDTSPPPRAFHSMVYDSARQRIVLFGGQSDGGTLDDTWEYYNDNWVKVLPTDHPTGRWSHAMAYDPHRGDRGKVVLFGGWDGVDSLNDTWEYDGETENWSKITIAPPIPSIRYNHAIVYNADRNRVMLFGGFDGNSLNSLNDSWEYDGSTWTLLGPCATPPARHGHRLVYNSNWHRVVLFGGRQSETIFLDDTWEYDGSTWTQILLATRPQPRSHCGLAYDSGRDQVVLFGGWDGWDGTPRFDDTWEYGPPMADLEISKTDNPDPVTAGGALTYTLAVTNTGPSDATGVTVTDTLPAGVTYVSATPSQGSPCNEAGGTIICNFDSIANGNNVAVTIVVTVHASTTGTLTNTAEITATTSDPDPNNNTTTEETAVEGVCIPGDCNGDGVVNAGDISACVLEIFDGDGIQPEDAPGGTFPGTPCCDSNQDGIIDAGDISCIVRIIFYGPGACSGGSNVKPTGQPVPLGQAVSLDGPALAIPDDVPASPAGSANVPVNYTANGHSISSVILSVDYDEEWLSFDATDGNGDGIPDTVTFNLPSAFNGSVTFDATDTDGELDFFMADLFPPLASLSDGEIVSIELDVGEAPGGTVTVVGFSQDPAASFGNTEGQSVPGTTDDGSVIIGGSADLVIVKADDPDPVMAGEVLTYTLSVTNTGPSNASGVIVTDTLPVGVTFESATPSQGSPCGEASGTVTCNLGTIASGHTATVTIAVIVDASVAGVLSNRADVAASTSDPDTGNNTATEDTTVEGCYDFDGDGQVDVDDVMRVASRWRTSCDNPDPDDDPGTPSYEARYDLDGDCDIDIVDIMIVVTHWGEICFPGSEAYHLNVSSEE